MEVQRSKLLRKKNRMILGESQHVLKTLLIG